MWHNAGMIHAGLGGVVLLSITALASCGGHTTGDPRGGARNAVGGAGGGEAGSSTAPLGSWAGASPSGGGERGAGTAGLTIRGTAAGAGDDEAAGAAGSSGGIAGDSSDAGGVGSDACTAPPLPGDCDLNAIQYRHDPALGVCVPFEFNACDASPNRYATRDDCLAACHGGDPDLDACAVSTDCLVTSLGCCGGCDPVDTAQLVAVNIDRVGELRELVGCGDVQCEQCLPVPPNDRTSRYAYAACERGQCVVRDLRERAIGACSSAADCRLRCGTSCCDGCSADLGVVAVGTGADEVAEFCDGSRACNDCECVIPPEFSVDCLDSRCVAVLGPVCTPGADQTCNAESVMSSVAGTCNPDGSCTCKNPFDMDLSTGRCW